MGRSTGWPVWSADSTATAEASDPRPISSVATPTPPGWAISWAGPALPGEVSRPGTIDESPRWSPATAATATVRPGGVTSCFVFAGRPKWSGTVSGRLLVSVPPSALVSPSVTGSTASASLPFTTPSMEVGMSTESATGTSTTDPAAGYAGVESASGAVPTPSGEGVSCAAWSARAASAARSGPG